jgi:hypothetical protein
MMRLRLGSRPAGKVRNLTQCEIELERGSDRPPTLDLCDEIRIEVRAIEQIEERRPRMGVRSDVATGNFAAVVESDRPRAAIPQHDALHAFSGNYLGTIRPGR